MESKRTKIYFYCWTLLAFNFLFSGVFRGLIFPEASNYIYFFPFPIVVTLFVVSLKGDGRISGFHFYCFMLSGILAIYQVLLVIFETIDLQTAIYGWFLYGLPFLGLNAARNGMNLKVILKIIAMFDFFLAPNLILAVLQTIFRDSRFYSAGFGEGLQSAFGIQRATGTFSSPAGYALYLSMTTSLLLMRNILVKTSLFRSLISYSLLAAQIPISGSRTAIISVMFVLATALVVRRRLRGSLIARRSFKIGFFFIISCMMIGVFFPNFQNVEIVKATSIRFAEANSIDPPTSRLLAQIDFKLDEIQPLYGSGLGSRANATTHVGVDWIEFDNQRIFIESGILLGALLLITRFGFAVRYFRLFLAKRFSAEIPLIASVVPVLLFGQLMGQGSISAGTWLGVYILEYMRRIRINTSLGVGKYIIE